MPKTKKRVQKKVQSDEEFAREVLDNVNRMKTIAEQSVTAKLNEMFAPSVKKMIAETITSMSEDDDFEEPSEDDLADLEDALEEADYSDELEDEEGEEEYNFENMEEGEVEKGEEDFEEEPEGEMDLDEEFMRELEALLEGGDDEDEDMGDLEDLEDLEEGKKDYEGKMDEDETGYSYSEKDPKPKMDAEPHHEGTDKEGAKDDELNEDETGYSYSEKDPKPKMDADPHTDAYIKENRRLKATLRQVMRTLNEVTLDNDKTSELQDIFENYNVPEKAKIRVLSAIDKATTKAEMMAISEAVKRQYKRKSSKVNESSYRRKQGGSKNVKSIKKGTKGKKLQEGQFFDWADRIAEVAQIK